MTSESQNNSPRSPLSPSDSFQSPLRQHQRASLSFRTVKETPYAHTEYSNSQDDGTSQLKINQYTIRQEIGRGSYGAVHLATDQYEAEYAVKEFSKTRLRRRVKSNLLKRPRSGRSPLSPSSPKVGSPTPGSPYTSPSGSVDEESSFALIKEEIAVMKKLNHPNLVSLLEVLDDPDDDSIFMVLEMCKKGVIMKVEVDDSAVPYQEETCRLWFRDLILGIEYLHMQGVIHRDIKPDNCLLAEDDTLKVSDFGVSEMFDRTSDMMIAKSAGSPAFMAPELCVVHHGGVSGTSADIWSMGATLYCLLFGKVPFRKSSVLDMFDSIRTDPVEIPSDCNESLRDLILRILEKDPGKRIKMADLREHPWVTKNGEDPLLSSEENCPEIVGPPTESEMNSAITGNVGRILAVIKAVNKFKGLLSEQRRPSIMNSILDQTNRLVGPPDTMLKGYTRASAGKMESFLPDISAQTAKQQLQSRGDSIGAMLAGKIDKLPEQVKTAVFSENKPEESTPDNAQTPSSPPQGYSLRKTQSSPFPVHFDNAKGHAHDPLDDRLFLQIGANPRDEAGTPNDGFVLSESPPAAGFHIFEEAYNDEVHDIMRRRRHQTTVYLTRRVEDTVSAKVANAKANAGVVNAPLENSTMSNFASIVGKTVGEAQNTPAFAKAANAAKEAQNTPALAKVTSAAKDLTKGKTTGK